MPGRPTFPPAAGVLAGAAAFALLSAVPAGAQQQPMSLGEAIFGRSQTSTTLPPVGRYTAGEQTFVLEQRGGQALLRFDGSDEVWVLRPQTGPRGDLIWRNDVGRPVLTASRLGGLTVFTPNTPSGAPAAFASSAPRFQLPDISPEALLRMFVEASVRASRAIRHMVRFEGPLDIRQGEEPVLAEAATLASQAITRVAARRQIPPAAARLRAVRVARVARGRRVDATIEASTMTVTVDPSRGTAGRPSSDKIYQALITAR